MFERLSPERHDTLDGIPEPSEKTSLRGHVEPASMLAEAYRAGKLPHALLLTGPQGIGKATLAFRLAHHLLKYPSQADAPRELAEPDPASSLYRQIAMAAHPGVLHLTRPPSDSGKGFKTVLTVEEIRKVSRFLSMTSHDGGYRIAIVDPANDMNNNAANALLKNLEEPPARTLFILISHSAGALLPTIRSRCQSIRLSPLPADDLSAALEDVGMLPSDPAKRDALLDRAGGSVRNAILLTEYGGVEIAEALDKLAHAPEHDIVASYKLADAVSGRERSVHFDIFVEHALDLVATAAREAALAGDTQRAARLSRHWQETRVATDEAVTYNLDRKQHALNMIARLHATLRM